MLNEEMICTGCGGNTNLSVSHIIPRSRRKDLIDAPENKTWHCLSVGDKVGCHQKHESLRIVELKDFEDSMRYMKRVDTSYFYLRYFKLKEAYKDNPEITEKLNKFELEIF
jgi:hypothetical protein